MHAHLFLRFGAEGFALQEIPMSNKYHLIMKQAGDDADVCVYYMNVCVCVHTVNAE